jgi:CBS domain-containing protein
MMHAVLHSVAPQAESAPISVNLIPIKVRPRKLSIIITFLVLPQMASGTPMQARDIMTTLVVSVAPETPVRDVAALMTDRRISGVPVIGADKRVLGVLSQGDLLHRHELGTEPRHKWWLRLFSEPDVLAQEYSKSHGLTAADVMARGIVSVTEDTELAEVAAILDRNNITRVPVLRDGVLIGIVARSDLVKALSRRVAPSNPGSIDNAALQHTLVGKMRSQSWLGASYVSTTVIDGRVELWGLVSSEAQHRALRVLVAETPGVKAVEDHLSVGRLPIAVT